MEEDTQETAAQDEDYYHKLIMQISVKWVTVQQRYRLYCIIFTHHEQNLSIIDVVRLAIHNQMRMGPPLTTLLRRTMEFP